MTAFAGTAEAAAPVRGGAFCWDFDLVGTDRAERLEGTAGPEHVAAYDGDDEVLAFGGDDCVALGLGDDHVHLGPGDDEASGGTGWDTISGGPGNDVLVPGLGPDQADGGDGDDLIRDERGDAAADVLTGGEGHDVIRSVDFAADRVECGPGYDVAIVDPRDAVSDCERVEVARRPRLSSRALRTGARPAFAIRWTRSDLSAPARLSLRLTSHPPRSAGCDVGSWRARGTRVDWRGRRRACPGEYAFTLTWFDGRSGGPRVACERVADAPTAGCTPSERLGVLRIPVR
ncbi:MAG TPA: calcium-binding protein [Solirubrobacteraceae bacterium]